MLDFIVGVLAFAVLMMVLATLGNTTVANGFYGRLTGLTGEVLNFYPPAWAKWLIAVGFLSVLWLGPAAHSWSLFRFYGDRLNKAYMLEPDGHEPKNQSVAPRVPRAGSGGRSVSQVPPKMIRGRSGWYARRRIFGVAARLLPAARGVHSRSRDPGSVVRRSAGCAQMST